MSEPMSEAMSTDAEGTPGATTPPAAAPQGDGVPGPAPQGTGTTGQPAAPAAGRAPTEQEAAATARAGGKAPNRVRMTWDGEHRFDVGRPDKPTIRIDSDGITGPGPVDTLLAALVTCVSTDVVDILAKRRTPVESLSAEVAGTREDGVPRQLIHVRLDFTIRGAGIERVHAERAIDLAVTKYCSVRDSLDPQLPVEWTLDLGDGL